MPWAPPAGGPSWQQQQQQAIQQQLPPPPQQQQQQQQLLQQLHGLAWVHGGQPLPPAPLQWELSMGPVWDPSTQQWMATPGSSPQQPLWPASGASQVPASAATAAAAGLGWPAAQAAALAAAAAAQPQGAPQAQQATRQGVQRGNGGPLTKLERDLPPGGPGEALLRLAVQICW